MRPSRLPRRSVVLFRYPRLKPPPFRRADFIPAICGTSVSATSATVPEWSRSDVPPTRPGTPPVRLAVRVLWLSAGQNSPSQGRCRGLLQAPTLDASFSRRVSGLSVRKANPPALAGGCLVSATAGAAPLPDASWQVPAVRASGRHADRSESAWSARRQARIAVFARSAHCEPIPTRHWAGTFPFSHCPIGPITYSSSSPTNPIETNWFGRRLSLPPLRSLRQASPVTLAS